MKVDRPPWEERGTRASWEKGSFPTSSVTREIVHTGEVPDPCLALLNDFDRERVQGKVHERDGIVDRSDRTQKPAYLESLCSQSTVKCEVHRKIPKTQLS